MSLVTPTVSALGRRAAAAITGWVAASMGRSVELDAKRRSAVHAAGFRVPRGTQTDGARSAPSHMLFWTLFWLTGRISAFMQASTWEISLSARVRAGSRRSRENADFGTSRSGTSHSRAPLHLSHWRSSPSCSKSPVAPPGRAGRPRIRLVSVSWKEGFDAYTILFTP